MPVDDERQVDRREAARTVGISNGPPTFGSPPAARRPSGGMPGGGGTGTLVEPAVRSDSRLDREASVSHPALHGTGPATPFGARCACPFPRAGAPCPYSPTRGSRRFPPRTSPSAATSP